MLNYPHLVLVISFLALWFAEWVGVTYRKQRPNLDEDQRDNFNLIAAATLTLLGLIIGFSFSMAISRYDQRKNYEEAEANAIGTEYVRADLLPAPDGAKVRGLLASYLGWRVAFYITRDEGKLQQVNAATAQLQSDMWTAVAAPAVSQPTPVITLTVAGMNDVLNSQGYTQAAWWNRIPASAWGLMGLVGACSSLLTGYGARRIQLKLPLSLVLPFVVSFSFFLISDIDCPRGGTIRVRPQNLESLSQSLRQLHH
jgi:hypothetical protein